MHEDINVCNEVIAMWDYAELEAIEKRSAKSMTEEQRRFLIQAEKAAGVF